MSLQWALGWGLPVTLDKTIALCWPPSPPPHPPALLMAFLPAGVCAGPHLVPVGVPPPPNSSFLDRGTFVWGLDGEQGAFEWLAEDWGHREGQGQERGGSALATSWTPGDPQHHCGGGKKAAGARPEKGCHGECWRAGQGQEVSRSRLCWRLSAGGREKGLPPPPPGPHSSAGKDEVGARNTRPDIYILYVGPSGKFSIPGPRLRQGFPSIPIKERPVSTKSGAQSGCGSVKAGGSEGVRNREREA